MALPDITKTVTYRKLNPDEIKLAIRLGGPEIPAEDQPLRDDVLDEYYQGLVDADPIVRIYHVEQLLARIGALSPELRPITKTKRKTFR